MNTGATEKLLRIADSISREGYANLTRLTVLEKWLDGPARMAGLGVWVATQAVRAEGKNKHEGEARQLFKDSRAAAPNAPLQNAIDRSTSKASQWHSKTALFSHQGSVKPLANLLRKGYLTLSSPDPISGLEREFFLSQSTADHLLRCGPSSKYFAIQSAVMVIENPLMIFKGLERDGKEDALCFVGKPDRFGDGWKAPASPGWIFLVFVTGDGVIFEWRWEKSVSESDSNPSDCNARFGELIWKHSSSS